MWEYVKGSEADFEGAPEWARYVSKAENGQQAWEQGTSTFEGNKYQWKDSRIARRYTANATGINLNIIAERRKVDNLQSRVNDANLQQAFDTVQRPAHYNQSGIECIDAIAAAVKGKSGIEAVLVGNVIKYLWRYELKGGLESLLKAQWYLEKLIQEKTDDKP